MNITGYNPGVSADEYKKQDAALVNKGQLGELQYSIDKIKQEIDDKLSISNSNLKQLNAQVLESKNQDAALTKLLNNLNSEQANSSVTDSQGIVNKEKLGALLGEENLNKLQDLGLIGKGDSAIIKADDLKQGLEEAIATNKSILSDVESKLKQEQANITQLENDKNIQLNRLKNTTLSDGQKQILDDISQYGCAMALALFQMDCAKKSNQDAFVQLEVVKLVQNKCSDISDALEAARDLKSLIDSKGSDDDISAKLKTLKEKLQVVNEKIDFSKITIDHGEDNKTTITSEQLAKCNKFDQASISDPQFTSAPENSKKESKDDREKRLEMNSQAISSTIDSLTTWQSQYNNHVSTMMVELQDASSKYSTFLSGSNQSMQKATDLLSKLASSI